MDSPTAYAGVYAGALVVVLLVGNWPVDRFGRKPALWAVQVFMIIAALIELFATNWKHWLVAKILNVIALLTKDKSISQLTFRRDSQ